MTFKAPTDEGDWDVRMFDSDTDGRERASVSFKVKGRLTDVSLTCNPQEVSPGASIQVTFKAPSTLDASAWIGIVPSHIPHGKEAVNDSNNMGYQYISNKTSGVMTFKAPERPGSYDFRMHDNDNSGNEIAHVTFTVR